MNYTTSPLLAGCKQCPWEYPCSSEAEKQRREKVHTERAHLPTAEAVTALLTDDPTHQADAQAVIDAIELDANANSGEVDPNRVRGLLPSWVTPQVIGATYQTLIRQGRLTQVGWTTNLDRKGRNVGRPQPVYEMREVRRERHTE